IRLQQVCTRIGRSAYVVDELCLHGGNLALDLGAFLSTRGLGEQNLRLDVIDHVDGIVHGGVGRVDLACAQAERVLHDRIRLVVRAHCRRDRPVGGVVAGIRDTIARRNAVLRFFELLVGCVQALQGCHCRDIRHDACHGTTLSSDKPPTCALRRRLVNHSYRAMVNSELRAAFAENGLKSEGRAPWSAALFMLPASRRDSLSGTAPGSAGCCCWRWTVPGCPAAAGLAEPAGGSTPCSCRHPPAARRRGRSSPAAWR